MSDNPHYVAQGLLVRLLLPHEREEFYAHHTVHVHGKYATYRLLGGSSSYIIQDAEVVASACFALTTTGWNTGPWPSCDHMLANYLILKNDELAYWRTAYIQTRFARIRVPEPLRCGCGLTGCGNWGGRHSF